METTINHLNEDQIKELRELLEEKHTRIATELNRLETEELPGLSRGEEANDGYGDDAKRDQIRQRLVAQIKRRRKDLAEINAAKTRMQDGSYGFDERTGAPIPFARLQVIPTAREKVQ